MTRDRAVITLQDSLHIGAGCLFISQVKRISIIVKIIFRQWRNNSTLGEIVLWKRLHAGGMRGYTFNRQKPLDNYIVDFYCKPLDLVIAVDVNYHLAASQREKDNERQKVLERLGLSICDLLKCRCGWT